MRSTFLTLSDNLLIWSNDNLSSLQGLEGLNSVGENFSLTENKKLVNFCALKELSVDGNFISLRNAYNPTLSQIQSGACNEQ